MLSNKPLIEYNLFFYKTIIDFSKNDIFPTSLTPQDCFDFIRNPNKCNFILSNDMFYSFAVFENPFSLLLQNKNKNTNNELEILLLEDFYEQENFYIIQYYIKTLNTRTKLYTELYKKDCFFDDLYTKNKKYCFSIISELIRYQFIHFDECPKWYLLESYRILNNIFNLQISACKEFKLHCQKSFLETKSSLNEKKEKYEKAKTYNNTSSIKYYEDTISQLKVQMKKIFHSYLYTKKIQPNIISNFIQTYIKLEEIQ